MSTHSSDRSLVSTVVSGGVGGAVAWLLGYALTHLAASRQVERALSDLNTFVGVVGGNEIPTWKAVGWLYLNAHTVVLRITGLPGGTQTYDLIAESEGGSAALLYLVPVVVLLVVVAVAVAVSGARDAGSGAVGGAGAVVGYLLVTAVFALLTAHSLGGDVRAAPALVSALLLAGFAYPLVVGSVAGAVVGLVRSEETGQSTPAQSRS
ncbi:transporter [Halomarina oriensis]|uniref:Transporter n=1 Tax=Halomarina oriensis TaxID=671145 RepID=A0A6B0GQ33_9EURY|nr:transporter [Halomarina oriensis]MWG34225.1 transporter [Halomarina oriensis]